MSSKNLYVLDGLFAEGPLVVGTSFFLDAGPFAVFPARDVLLSSEISIKYNHGNKLFSNG